MYNRPRPSLSTEELQLPLAKYYDLPLAEPGPREMQIINACPIDPALAIKPENFLDLLQPEGYQPVEYGYCIMPDGTGYLAVYTTYPNCTPQMLGWWFRWLNIHSKGMPKGRGNLKYKIWNPLDHWDHGFVNGKDKMDDIWTVETLDLGAGEQPVYTVRHHVDLFQYGLTKEKDAALKAVGCWVDSAYESFHTVDPSHTQTVGTHLMLTLSRTSPLGIMEKCTREWIGWGVKDGKVFRDESTPASMLCEAYLKKVIIHATVEAQQLSKFLPALYAQYKDLPDDAD
jgi:DAPG hydrolase PhiG domain